MMAAPLTEGWRLRKEPYLVVAGQVGGWWRSWGEWILWGSAQIPPLEAVMPIPPPQLLAHSAHPKLCPSQGPIDTQ